jgi:hypothetical protein
MYLFDCFPPYFNGAKVLVKDREVKWRVLVIPPRAVNEWRAGNVNSLSMLA